MSGYRYIRKKFKYDIKQGKCYCILSGLQITDPSFLSVEHYCPICRGPYFESRQSYNIFPAYKIINNLKGHLLPCEWQKQKEQILQKALKKSKLKKHDKEIVQAALNNIKNYNINPCNYCILYKGCPICR